MARRGFPTAAYWGLGALAIIGGAWLLAPSDRPITLEQAARARRAGDGEWFSQWLMLYRHNYLHDELRLGDPQFNRTLMQHGLQEAGVSPWLLDDAAAVQRALCARYRESRGQPKQALPAGWSESMRAYAADELAAWSRACA